MTKRTGEIDILRLVFCIIIVFFHFRKGFHDLSIFPNGYIGVEFFFVVSGFLMSNHVFRNKLCMTDSNAIADETWHYTITKIKRFYRYYLVAFFTQIIVRFIFVEHTSFSDLFQMFLRSLNTLALTFFIIEENAAFYLRATWFLSALVVACFILYPFLLRCFGFSTKVLFPVIAVFSLGYIVNYSSISVISDRIAFFPLGFLRAIAELSLGASLFQLSLVLRSTVFAKVNGSLAATVIITTIKCFCYTIVISFAHGSLLGIEYDDSFGLFALLFCSIGVLLSFSQLGLTIPDCKLSRFMGKASLPIFIFHGFIQTTIWEYRGTPSSNHLNLLYICGTICVAIAFMYLTDALSLLINKFLKRKSPVITL